MKEAPASGTAAIALDDWKLPIFRKRLKKAGYEYEDAGGFAGQNTILKVKYTDLKHLTKVVTKCEDECRKKRL